MQLMFRMKSIVVSNVKYNFFCFDEDKETKKIPFEELRNCTPKQLVAELYYTIDLYHKNFERELFKEFDIAYSFNLKAVTCMFNIFKRDSIPGLKMSLLSQAFFGLKYKFIRGYDGNFT